MLGGITIPGCIGLSGNSDADVVLHAVTNAVSGLHGMPVIGTIADDLCLKKASATAGYTSLKSLEMLTKYKLLHVSVAIEAARPRLEVHLPAMRKSVAGALLLTEEHVAVTVTSGEGLTAFGRGEGIQVFAIVSAETKNV